MTSRLLGGGALALALALSLPATAQVAVSGNDNRRRLVDGANTVVANPPADSITIIDLGGRAPRVVGEVALSHSVVGPPTSVAITPDERFAIVTSAERLDPADPTKVRPYGMGITPDGRWAVAANIGRGSGDTDTVTLINMEREPYLAVDTVSVGPTPEGIQVSPDNRHVAVTIHNGSARPQGHPLRGRAQLVMLRIDNGRLREVARVPVGDWAQGIAFSRDGRTVLVQNMADRTIGVFRIENGRLRDTGQRIPTNGGPAAIRTADAPPAPPAPPRPQRPRG